MKKFEPLLLLRNKFLASERAMIYKVVLVIIFIAFALVLYFVSQGDVVRHSAKNSSQNEVATSENEHSEDKVKGSYGKEKVEKKENIYVDVSGAVNSPGVFKLDGKSRVSDAIESAGGAREDANLDAINRALPLEDGAKVVVPLRRESSSDENALANSLDSKGTLGTGTSQGEVTNTGKVNINTCSEKDLESIPGIGPATAKMIVDYRTSKGNFSAIEDLTGVKGIGTKKLEKMKVYLTL